MAGFMAGFGNAFATSYDKANERRAARDDEEFRYTFQALLDRKKETKAYKQKDADIVKQAKYLQSVEFPDNPDAVGDIYTGLKAGGDASYVIKKLKGGTWKSPAAAPDASAPAAPQGVNPNDQVSSADEQTVAALPGAAGGLPDSVGGTVPESTGTSVQPPVAAMGAPQAPAPETPTPPVAAPQPQPDAAPAPQQVAQAEPAVAPDNGAGIVSDRTRARIERVTGEPLDLSTPGDITSMEPSGKFIPGADVVDFPSDKEIQYKFDTAKTPADKELYGGMLKAVQERVDAEALAKNPQNQNLIMFKDDQGTWRTKATMKDDQGNQVLAGDGSPVPQGARQIGTDEYKVRQEIAKGTEGGQKLLSKQAKVVSLYPDATALIQEAYAQPAVLNSVGSISSWISAADANIQSVQKIITTSAPESAEVDNSIKQIDNMLATTPITDIAQRTSLFRSKILLMGYRAGDIEGQKGQSLGEKDYTRLQAVLQGADANPATFAKLMKSYMADLTANTDVEIKSYNDSNGLAQEYEQNFGEGSAPGAAFIKPMEKMIMNSDDKTKQAYMDLQKSGEVQIPEKTPDPSTDLEPIDLQTATQLLKENPSDANKAYFDATYGHGSAAKALVGK